MVRTPPSGCHKICFSLPGLGGQDTWALVSALPFVDVTLAESLNSEPPDFSVVVAPVGLSVGTGGSFSSAVSLAGPR